MKVMIIICVIYLKGKAFHLYKVESPLLNDALAKFGWNWPGVSGEEDENVKILQRQLQQRRRRTTDKANLSLWLRWAKKPKIQNFLLQTAWLISSELGAKQPWVKGIKVAQMKGHVFFPRGDNCEITKIHWKKLKILFSRTNWSISTKLETKHFGGTWTQVCFNLRALLFFKGKL